jgi:hypothetical protein
MFVEVERIGVMMTSPTRRDDSHRSVAWYRRPSSWQVLQRGGEENPPAERRQTPVWVTARGAGPGIIARVSVLDNCCDVHLFW